jgi:hypothetical protein
MPEGEVDCVDQAVVEEALLVRHCEVEEGPVGADQLRGVDLTVEPLGVVVAGDELVGLLLLELFDVGLLGGLAVGSDEASVPEVLFGDVELLPQLCMAMAEVAEEGDPLDTVEVARNARDPDPRHFTGNVYRLWRHHEDQEVEPYLLIVLPLERNFI